MRTSARMQGRGRTASQQRAASPRSPGAAGWEAGYAAGLEDGKHYGVCESIYRLAPTGPKELRGLTVLYVRAAGAPYAALDAGIEDALRKTVRSVAVASPEDNVAALCGILRPDLVLVLDAAGRSFSTEQVDRIRALGFRTAVWLPDDPYHSDQTVEVAPHYDNVFTLESACVELYRSVGCRRVFHLPFAVNSAHIRQSRPDPAYASDICFVGSAFWNRVRFFDQIADYLADKRLRIIGYWWERLSQYERLADRISNAWLSPEETAKYYSGAKLVINLHRSTDDASHNENSRHIPAHSVNPRLFEIASCATLQLVDRRSDLPKLYVPGRDLATFETPDELVRLIDYYLTHEAVRRAMIRNSLYRTVTEHTYYKRIEQLLTAVFI